jgi:hypothetical protein
MSFKYNQALIDFTLPGAVAHDEHDASDGHGDNACNDG